MKTIKKIISLLILVLVFSCNSSSTSGDGQIITDFKTGNDIKSTTQNSKVDIEYISGFLTNNSNSDNGLYKVTLNDGREILIYRGVESVSMIQLQK